MAAAALSILYLDGVVPEKKLDLVFGGIGPDKLVKKSLTLGRLFCPRVLPCCFLL